MIKKKTLVILFLLVSTLTMTSCINIVEKVFFKKNGGGTYSMTLDMSQVASMMAAMGEGDNEMTQALDEMENDFEASKNKLEGVVGVSNVTQELNSKDLIFTVSFDFEDVDALNRGMSEYYHDQADGTKAKQYTFYTKNRKTITRTSVDLIGDSIKKELGSDDEEGDIDMAVVLADMYHETVLEFEQNVKDFSNENYQQNGNRAISWKRYLFNKRDAEQSMEVKVTIR